MRDRFSIATWNTQLLEFPSEEALQQLGESKAAVDKLYPAAMRAAAPPSSTSSPQLPNSISSPPPAMIWSAL